MTQDSMLPCKYLTWNDLAWEIVALADLFIVCCNISGNQVTQYCRLVFPHNIAVQYWQPICS